MTLDEYFDTPELISLRQEIVADLVSLAYWIQMEVTETEVHVSRSEEVIKKINTLNEKTPSLE